MQENAESRLTPIIKRVAVAVPPERCFAVFTASIHQWWPRGSHSVFGEATTHIEIEPRVGGRVTERSARGETTDWGVVLAWEPPRRLRLTWRVGHAAATREEVEVRFLPNGTGGTDVVLEHHGWEAAAWRSQYEGGWDFVLGKFAGHLRERIAP